MFRSPEHSLSSINDCQTLLQGRLHVCNNVVKVDKKFVRRRLKEVASFGPSSILIWLSVLLRHCSTLMGALSTLSSPPFCFFNYFIFYHVQLEAQRWELLALKPHSLSQCLPQTNVNLSQFLLTYLTKQPLPFNKHSFHFSQPSRSRSPLC